MSTGFLTTGDVTATSGAFVQIGTDLTITAAAGDVLVLAPEALGDNTGADTQFEAATRVSGADTNYWSTGTSTSRWPGGLPAWYLPSSHFTPMAAPVPYTVQAGDIVSGQVTVRFYARSTGASRVISANANYPVRLTLYNYGP